MTQNQGTSIAIAGSELKTSGRLLAEEGEHMTRIHHCSGVLHRAKSRGVSVSAAIRSLYGYRRYNCEGCGWHGWMRNEDPPIQIVMWRKRLHAVLGATLTIAVTTALTIVLSSLV
jgi:hypothetical protein